MLAVDNSSISKWIDKPVKDKKKQERNDKIQELHEQGKTQQEIAEEVGVAQIEQSAILIEKRKNLE